MQEVDNNPKATPVAGYGLFDGATFDPSQDAERLASQLERVRDLMLDGRWRTLKQITRAVRGSEAGVSARLRDLRKSRFGGFIVDRRRMPDLDGLWEYQVVVPEPRQAEMFGGKQ